MRRRTAFRSYFLARLLLCLTLLAQSSAVSAATSSIPERAERAAPAISASSAASKAPASAPDASCEPNACAIYLPWMMLGAPPATPSTDPSPTPAPPTSTPAEPTPIPPSATPIPSPTTPAGDVELPSAPANLRAARKTATSISLAWDAAADNIAVTEYEIYSGATLVLTTTDLFATVSGLTPGTTYTWTVVARDAAGNRSFASAALTVATDAAQPEAPDTQAPAAPAHLRAVSTTHGTVALAWDAAQDDVGVAKYDLYDDGVWLDSTTGISYTATDLLALSSHSFSVTASDSSGNVSGASDALHVTTTLPPDPATLAPAVDQTVANDIASDTAFLYSGRDPIQSGAAGWMIQPQLVAILRGRAIARDGSPLAGVRISIHNRPEYGSTVSRADGAFDFAVSGGGRLIVDYQKDGYLPAQRQAQPPLRDYLVLPDVALVALDPLVTTISLGEDSTLQAAAGGVVSDTDGVRQALLIFPAATTATLDLPDGEQQPLTTLHVRATEYTVGERGPQAMPGPLPIESGYTYAVDYSVDEALAAGARQVRFSQPVIGYVENFLHFRLQD